PAGQRPRPADHRWPDERAPQAVLATRHASPWCSTHHGGRARIGASIGRGRDGTPSRGRGSGFGRTVHRTLAGMAASDDPSTGQADVAADLHAPIGRRAGERAARVLVIDDHSALAEAVAMAIDTQADLDCVGTAATIAE